MLRTARIGGHVSRDRHQLGEGYAGYALSRAFVELADRGLCPAFVVIGEASNLNLKRGQRGRIRVSVRVGGRPAHSAHPRAGANAIYRAAHLIAKVRAREPDRDSVLGENVRELIGTASLPDPASLGISGRSTIGVGYTHRWATCHRKPTS